MSFVVKKRQNGSWTEDGTGLSWTRAQAEAHVVRCEYDGHGIEYRIVEVESDKVQPTKHNGSAGKSSRKRTKKRVDSGGGASDK